MRSVTTRIWPLLLTVAATFGIATILVASLESLSFAYRSEAAHVAVETAASVIALLAAWILLGRLREHPSPGELALLIGLGLLALANLARAIAPSFSGDNPEVVWLPLSTTLVAGAALALAPFVRPGRLEPRQIAVSVGALAAITALLIVASNQLPVGIDPTESPADSKSARIVGSTELLAAQLVAVAVFTVAAFGFGRRAMRTNDEFLAWLAIAMALAALARFNYFLFPSTVTDWVFTGDFLRLATYLVILTGALRQISAYQRSAARIAVLEERTRIARDLHDGIAQDLAYISLEGTRLSHRQPEAESIAWTAQHALRQSRDLIGALRSADASLGGAVSALATVLADRHGASLELEIDDEVDATPEARSDLLHVLSEAISNAARHGGASRLSVMLARDAEQGITLTITDNGRGFEVDKVVTDSDSGLGLRGIRERIERRGGRVEIRSRPLEGTALTVVIP